MPHQEVKDDHHLLGKRRHADRQDHRFRPCHTCGLRLQVCIDRHGTIKRIEVIESVEDLGPSVLWPRIKSIVL